MEGLLTKDILEKLLFPLIMGIVGWFVKDFIFAVSARRDELVRKEWERQLLEVWSPLYYWSGIVMLKDKEKGWNRHGLDKLEQILTKSAHHLPLQHYNNMIKLIQTLTGQETVEPFLSDIKATRRYIYDQVKVFNYLLYRRNDWFEPTSYTDFFAGFKYLIRFISQALKHIVGWLLVVAVIAGIYQFYVDGKYWAVIVVVVLLLVPILYDWNRQFRLHRELSKKVG
jgi:hypothetical protein